MLSPLILDAKGALGGGGGYARIGSLHTLDQLVGFGIFAGWKSSEFGDEDLVVHVQLVKGFDGAHPFGPSCILARLSAAVHHMSAPSVGRVSMLAMCVDWVVLTCTPSLLSRFASPFGCVPSAGPSRPGLEGRYHEIPRHHCPLGRYSHRRITRAPSAGYQKARPRRGPSQHRQSCPWP